ncbi:MAG TPA: hypothetical protein VGM50_13670 [Gemmatimonadaceae bacterium]|jgi:hypothetical protein
MTYDQLCDLATNGDRTTRLAIAEAILSDERGDADSELMAAGEICFECGQRLTSRQGRPTICRDCGGTVACNRPRVAAPDPAAVSAANVSRSSDGASSSPWYAGDRYFANAADAAFWRHHERERRARHASRVARFLNGDGR